MAMASPVQALCTGSDPAVLAGRVSYSSDSLKGLHVLSPSGPCLSHGPLKKTYFSRLLPALNTCGNKAEDQEKPAPIWGWGGAEGPSSLPVFPGAAGQHKSGQVPQGAARAGRRRGAGGHGRDPGQQAARADPGRTGPQGKGRPGHLPALCLGEAGLQLAHPATPSSAQGVMLEL